MGQDGNPFSNDDGDLVEEDLEAVEEIEYAGSLSDLDYMSDEEATLAKRRYPSWRCDRIRVHLWRTARDLGASGRDWATAYGLVNAYSAVR